MLTSLCTTRQFPLRRPYLAVKGLRAQRSFLYRHPLALRAFERPGWLTPQGLDTCRTEPSQACAFMQTRCLKVGHIIADMREIYQDVLTQSLHLCFHLRNTTRPNLFQAANPTQVVFRTPPFRSAPLDLSNALGCDLGPFDYPSPSARNGFAYRPEHACSTDPPACEHPKAPGASSGPAPPSHGGHRSRRKAYLPGSAPRGVERPEFHFGSGGWACLDCPPYGGRGGRSSQSPVRRSPGLSPQAIDPLYGYLRSWSTISFNENADFSG